MINIPSESGIMYRKESTALDQSVFYIWKIGVSTEVGQGSKSKYTSFAVPCVPVGSVTSEYDFLPSAQRVWSGTALNERP
jgi:hypothetical protein